jgi:glycosyltransferase involved in cell wall biosynthesis
MSVSVIISTYNSPNWLQKVLWGFSVQTTKDFEIVIADDGSTAQTLEMIKSMRTELSMPIRHVWQTDDGFQKCRILNKAIVAAQGDYLIFTDGDCIPRADFVATHIQEARPDHFLSGGYFKLPMNTSLAISQADITSQRAFDVRWLTTVGLVRSHKDLKLTAQGWVGDLLNILSPARKTWNGNNSSCAKKHVVAVNGFNEHMQYGGEDCEFGDRLKHYGLRAKRIRFSTVCVHLDHSRGYVAEGMIKKNIEIRKQTIQNQTVRCSLGVDQWR